MNNKISGDTASAFSVRKAIRSWAQPLAGVAIVFAVWYLVCKAEILSVYVLPTPEKVFRSFLKMLQSGELARDIGISFLRVLKGFAIAFVLAFVLGMFRALFPKTFGYYEHTVQFFRNVPPLSMIPLLILWCGIGETTKTVIIVLASFFPMYLNIVKGFTDHVWIFRAAEVLPYCASLRHGRYSGGHAYWTGVQLACDYRSGDGGCFHRTGPHDSICPADVPHGQGHCRYSGDWNRGLCDGPFFWCVYQYLFERIWGKWLELN